MRVWGDSYSLLSSKLSIEYQIGFKQMEFHSDDALLTASDNVYQGLDYDEKLFYRLSNDNPYSSVIYF